ncbi:MAG: MFS transporter [Actinomycetes bacterium]
MQELNAKKELNYLRILFFLFGLGIMSWVPRYPEVKAALKLDNGAFGSLISTGAIGSVVSLLTVGHIVHKIGVKKVLQVASFLLTATLTILSHTNSVPVFFVTNILFLGSISAFHISINAQGFNYQDRTGKFVITQLSGLWSAGALATAFIAGLLVDHVSLGTHVTVLMFAIFITNFFIIKALSPELIKANTDTNIEYRFRNLLKGFSIDRMVSIGLICAIFLEFAISDWATIYTKEEIGIRGGFNTLPYILFTLMMIFGRFTIHYLLPKFTLERMAVFASLLAGTSFLTSIFLARTIFPSHQNLAFLIICIGFTLAGLGSSFLGPTFMTAANARSKHPASVVIGQVGVSNIVLAFVLKWILAWTAQLTSLSIGLVIPGLLLLTVPFFAKVLKNV